MISLTFFAKNISLSPLEEICQAPEGIFFADSLQKLDLEQMI